ncbi:hypothetical protein WJX72_008241 [[Myrmecia] bisecta]|uniref:Uncharacterized protein n=1 Tax=[Myrmecia] bisecta TaxID=41462 RepID=A0AAW1R917_9CHLO
MREEMVTLLKEKEERARDVEFITVEKDYNVTRSDAYSPKVATWGVFPRPQNISEAYGGGRTLRPGQALETAEQTAERKANVAKALADYKKAAGLVVDPEVEALGQAAFDRGSDLFRDGRIAAALVEFTEAAELMPMRTTLGGLALLQRAICLDSLGRHEEAFPLYKKVERHPAPGVARQAKRMVFGFDAAVNLKTHTMNFGVEKGAYDNYFNRLSGQWAYYSSSDEDQGDNALPTVVATTVMLVPFLFIGGKVLKLF